MLGVRERFHALDPGDASSFTAQHLWSDLRCIITSQMHAEYVGGPKDPLHQVDAPLPGGWKTFTNPGSVLLHHCLTRC